MSQYFPEAYLSNYATKTDLKNVTHVDTSSFALKTNLAGLKTEVDQLDIKYYILAIFCNWRKYHFFRKRKIKENIIFSIIFDIFRNKSIKQDSDKKVFRGLNTVPRE